MSKLLKFAAIALVALIGLRWFGYTPASVAAALVDKTRDAVTDTRALANGEYSAKTAERLRAEAELRKLHDAVPSSKTDNEDVNELLAARRRLLEEKSKGATEGLERISRGDKEGLRRQIEKQAQQAGGTE